jgi:pimeloyl-ACP methyl ester carboxylesterase
VERLVLLGHSMGGLLARSALHYGAQAGYRWPSQLGDLVFLGTPHHGAPLERAGHWVDIVLGATPYAAPFARLGKVRSAGITDLRHGNLLDEDWVAIVLHAVPTDGNRCRCPSACAASPWRQASARKVANSRSACSVMAWCRWTAHWATTATRRAR